MASEYIYFYPYMPTSETAMVLLHDLRGRGTFIHLDNFRENVSWITLLNARLHICL